MPLSTQTTQTNAFADDATTSRLMAAMEAFMAADFVDDIAASVAAALAQRDANMQQAA